MSTTSARDEALFSAALARPATERAAFLDGACGADTALRARIDALLAAHEGTESLLRGSAPPRELLELEKPGDWIGLSAVLSAVGLAKVEGSAKAGRYKLLQQIGEGGCSIVWMAEQEEPVRRRVALKVIKLGMDTKAVVARFEAERQALAMMDHPNIAKVHDAGSTDTGRPFFVMELVRGIPITKYCDENHLNPTERLELFIKVCHAVQHAHQKGIIHRDLKPSNILVTVNDGQPTPKVIDFGIAKATQGKLTDATVFTAFEQFIGTPVYMSPEQAEMSSLDIDTRSDIYSLGVLLYELLTGRPPFDPKAFAQAGVDQIRQQIREVEPATPSRRLGTMDDGERTTVARLRNIAPAQLSVILRGDLDWIVMRCIEKDRTRRYDTANGLAMDIQRYLRHEPVIARPPSTAYLLRKLIRRHRLGFAAAVGVAFTLVTGAIISTWQAVRATRAEFRAEGARRHAEAQEAIARQQESKARHRAYTGDMQLVQQALAVDNVFRARELLERQKPLPDQTDLRGWEWRYLWQFSQTDRLGELGRKASLITSLAVSADGQWLAVGAQNEELTVVNITTRQELRLPRLRGNVRVAFSPQGSLLATYANRVGDEPAGIRHRITLWNMTTKGILRELPLAAGCGEMFFSGDGERLCAATLHPDSKIIVWRVSDGAVARFLDAPQTAFGESTLFAATADLSLAAHGTPTGHVRVVDLPAGVERWSQSGADEGNVIASLAFSPDQTLLATSAAVADHAIRLWDVATGKLVGRLEGHRAWVIAVLFWPDGKTLASAGADRTIRIWDVSTGRLLSTLRGHQREVNRLVLLRDNTTLVSAGREGSIFLWDALSRPEEKARTRMSVPVEAWRFANDSKSVMTIDVAGQVVRWSGAGFREKQLEFDVGPIAGNPVSVLLHRNSFSPNLRFLAIQRPQANQELEVWDTASRIVRHRFKVDGNVSPPAVFTSERKLRVVAEEIEGMLLCREWDLSAGKETQSWRMPVPGRGRARLMLTYSDNGQQCLAVTPSGRAFEYDFRTGISRTIKIEMAGRFPRYSPDGNLLAVPLMGGGAKLWHTANYREVGRLSTMMKLPHSMAFSSDGARLAIGCGEMEAVMVWDVDTWDPVLSLAGTGSVFLETAFSPDGNYLASRSGTNGFLHIWRAPSWEEIAAAEKSAATLQTRP